jgi:hypothetical protein
VVPKAARMTRQKTKTKKEDGEKMKEGGKRKGKTKWSSNQNTMKCFTPHMQVLEALENRGTLDRYLCVLVFVMSDEDPAPLPTSFPLFLLGFCTQRSTMMLRLQNTHPNTHIGFAPCCIHNC